MRFPSKLSLWFVVAACVIFTGLLGACGAETGGVSTTTSNDGSGESSDVFLILTVNSSLQVQLHAYQFKRFKSWACNVSNEDYLVNVTDDPPNTRPCGGTTPNNPVNVTQFITTSLDQSQRLLRCSLNTPNTTESTEYFSCQSRNFTNLDQCEEKNGSLVSFRCQQESPSYVIHVIWNYQESFLTVEHPDRCGKEVEAGDSANSSVTITPCNNDTNITTVSPTAPSVVTTETQNQTSTQNTTSTVIDSTEPGSSSGLPAHVVYVLIYATPAYILVVLLLIVVIILVWRARKRRRKDNHQSSSHPSQNNDVKNNIYNSNQKDALSKMKTGLDAEDGRRGSNDAIGGRDNFANLEAMEEGEWVSCPVYGQLGAGNKIEMVETPLKRDDGFTTIQHVGSIKDNARSTDKKNGCYLVVDLLDDTVNSDDGFKDVADKGDDRIKEDGGYDAIDIGSDGIPCVVQTDYGYSVSKRFCDSVSRDDAYKPTPSKRTLSLKKDGGYAVTGMASHETRSSDQTENGNSVIQNLGEMVTTDVGNNMPSSIPNDRDDSIQSDGGYTEISREKNGKPNTKDGRYENVHVTKNNHGHCIVSPNEGVIDAEINAMSDSDKIGRGGNQENTREYQQNNMNGVPSTFPMNTHTPSGETTETSSV